MENLTVLLEQIKKNVEPYKHKRARFTPKSTELLLLGAYARCNPFEGAMAAFDWGFVQGMKYERACKKEG